MFTNRAGVYVRQVSTKARYGRTANESRSEAGMPLLDESSHRACTGSRLEPGLHSRWCQVLHNPWGCPGSEKKRIKRKKTKTRHREFQSVEGHRYNFVSQNAMCP